MEDEDKDVDDGEDDDDDIWDKMVPAEDDSINKKTTSKPGGSVARPCIFKQREHSKPECWMIIFPLFLVFTKV